MVLSGVMWVVFACWSWLCGVVPNSCKVADLVFLVFFGFYFWYFLVFFGIFWYFSLVFFGIFLLQEYSLVFFGFYFASFATMTPNPLPLREKGKSLE